MAQKRENRHQKYLAYRLGCLPFELLEGSGLTAGKEYAENAQWALFRLYTWIVEEGRQAIDLLGKTLPSRKRRFVDGAKQALGVRWDFLKNRYFQDAKPATDQKADSAIINEVVALKFVSVRDAHSRVLADSIRELAKILPPPLQDFAALADAVGDTVTWTPQEDSSAQDAENQRWLDTIALVSEAFGSGYLFFEGGYGEMATQIAHLQTLMCSMAEEHDILTGLDKDLSPAKCETDRYVAWAKQEARLLHLAILDRISPSRPPRVSDYTWISSTQASELSDRFGVPYSLSYLSRVARKPPFPFRWRPIGRKNLQIELSSFVQFLWARSQKQQPKEPVEDEFADEIANTKAKRGTPDLT